MHVSARPVPHDLVETPPASSRRELFLDLGRAVATLLMVQGHTIDAVLADSYRASTWFSWWTAVRGLTSCLFLFTSGFAFALSTYRRRATPARPAGMSGFGRRVAMLFVLGYALHFPSATIWELTSLDANRWQGFLIVDVLQCIAVTLILLHVLTRVAGTPQRYAALALIGCATIVLLTPLAWSVDWGAFLPTAIASYLSPAAGSPFPLFPWVAYGLFGTAVGALYVQLPEAWASTRASQLLATTGAVLVIASRVAPSAVPRPFGPGNFWSTSPSHFLLHAGLVCLFMALVAIASRLIARRRALIEPVARQSLLIYVVHLGLVYGSVWNAGLHQTYGHTLSLAAAVACVGLLWAVSAGLALIWHTCNRHTPRTAGLLRLATSGILVGRLL